MTIAATLIIVVVLLMLIESHVWIRQVLLIISVLLLLMQLVEYLLRPFVLLIAKSFQFVPYSELLVFCGIALFFSNIVTQLLQQLELEVFVPISELTIRFSLFAYCLQQLEPVLTSMTELLFSLA